ncbi:DUF4430 domain-containing protein [Paenibacillus sp. L3-i20]|uniref:DUF4430 domain-containing protein n=1 Tax=Paenibacillus sp. L3-i20 TaxID=2905833 RepID=UPI001EDCF7B3|nr:DUF4430 domain-containing protein [Paenibacillus sp. L3-i20]GKU76206.1 hypothetical protein L3i20_v206030 [Paenibacillus sp. L3-i20]
MNAKNWLWACLIAGVLAIAFFWGEDVPNDTEKLPVETLEMSESKSASSAEVQQEPTPTTNVKGTDQPTSTPSPVPTVKPTEVSETSEPAGQVSKKPEVEKPIKLEKPSKTSKPTETTKPENPEKPGKTTAKASPTTTAKPKKDKYETEPVPEGKPKPVEWQDTTINKKKTGSVTLSISAATILNNLDKFNEDKLEVLPEDGIIYPEAAVAFYEGESVFDVLLREMKNNKIHMEFNMTPIYNSNYIEGINNIYEFDCGELSGWLYKVNDWYPNYGSSRYALTDGDVIEWVYTCDLGRDVGADTAATSKAE